jgi:hypothetical protein
MKNLVFVLATAVSVSAASLTPLQTTTYESVEDGISTDFASPSSFGSGIPLTGFKKFDSSLGTLERILFTLESEISGTGTLEVYYESPAATPEGDENFDTFGSISVEQTVQTDIVYRDSPSTGIGTAVDLFDLSFFEDVFFDESSYSTPDSTLIFEYFGFEQPFNEGPSTSAGALDVSDITDISDFSGLPSDDIPNDALSVGFFVFIDDFSLDAPTDNGELDPSSVFIDLTVLMEAGTATLQYEYTPVPEPASTAALLGLVALMGISCRRVRE